MKRVLFTGGGGAGSEALAALLPGYEAHFADADSDARPHGVAPNRWHQIPTASAYAFVGELAWLCSELGVDVLVPGVDEELERLALVRDMFPSVLLPPTSFVVAHLDKLASYELLWDAEVGVPLTELVRARGRVGCPCILKPRRGRGSRGVAILRHPWEWYHDYGHLAQASAEDYIVSELLEGDEYTVTVAADQTGKLRAIVPCKVSLKRGITIRASTSHDSAVIEACQRIHDAYPVPGCYNVQCIKTASGEVKVFEINPRVSTTLCLAIAAGVDPIGIYLGHYPGDELLPFTEGLKLSRSWHNEFAV